MKKTQHLFMGAGLKVISLRKMLTDAKILESFLHLHISNAKMLINLIYKILIKDRQLRNAARFFYWIKAFKGSVNVFSVSELPADMPFTRYEKKICLEQLFSAGWIVKGKSDTYLLQGRSFFKNILNLRNTALYKDIPEAALLDKRAWKNFISGLALEGSARGVRSTTKKKDRIRHVACSNVTRGVSMTIPVSLSIISSHNDLSTSSACRLRQSGAKSSITSVTQQSESVARRNRITGAYSVITMTPCEFAMLVSEPGHGHYFLRKNQLWRKMSSLITFTQSKRRKS